MGSKRQQRLAEKRRRHGGPPHERERAGGFRSAEQRSAEQMLSGMSVEDLLRLGARVSFPTDDNVDPEQRDRIARALIAAVDAGGEVADRGVSRRALQLLTSLWEAGWLPLDIVHAGKRALPVRAVRLIAELIADDPGLGIDRPELWDQHLGAVSRLAGRHIPSVSALERWRRHENVALTEAVVTLFSIVGFVTHLPKLAFISDPPSCWAVAAARARTAAQPAGPRRTAESAGADQKTLDRIRALLAKAERTDFAAEAEAFTSKAQELMSRHAIDAAMLNRDRTNDLAGDVVSRRIYIDSPYAPEKAQLVGAVFTANGSRTVWDEQFGWATVVGFPVDLDLAELLYTSLLIQLTRAMSEAGRSGGHTKSPSFRRAFALSYAGRILERLLEAQERANTDAEREYGTALVPVLQLRRDAVDEITEAAFPSLREMRPRRVDAHGWRAGRTAADVASLHGGASELKDASTH